MSSDQITYVLVALIVTGVAILLLLAGPLVARRGRNGGRQAAPAAPAAEPVPAVLVAPAPAAAPAAIVAAVAAPAAPASETGFGPLAAHPEAEHPVEEAAVTSADLAAAARRVDDPREQEVIEGFLSIAPRRREAAYTAPSGPTATATLAVAPPASGSIPPDPYVDESTGLDSRAAWERILAEENARYVRYRRPVGIVVAELDGFPRFEGGFGAEASRRVLAAVGGAMRRSARRTDHVAHVGGGRFLVLLPETDEIQAINYVERIRGECDRWLDAGAVALRLSVGWASPSAVGELDTAVRTAEERMYTERRRTARAGVADPDSSR
ncbi:MAG TPA: GGDEF domain-containing protein [Candidatus Nanopelagicales bacterium]|nr:GGDEF domain-containing protein [Candidatus Nanopelagicales bacterium]